MSMIRRRPYSVPHARVSVVPSLAARREQLEIAAERRALTAARAGLTRRGGLNAPGSARSMGRPRGL